MTDTPVNFQLITHKGELVIVLSQPVTTLSFGPQQARELAQQLKALADSIDRTAVSKPN